MKAHGIGFFSFLKLNIRRALSRGGAAQFLIPLAFALVIWFLLAGLLGIMVHAGSLSTDSLRNLKDSLPESGVLGLAFFHLFTSGGQDLMSSGPGWLFTITGLVLIALLTSVLTNYFDKVSSDYSEGLSSYDVKGHTAVFGFNRDVPGLVRRMTESGAAGGYVLIMTRGDVRGAYALLAEELGRKLMRRVIVLKGDILSASSLDRMRVDQAAEFFVTGDGAGDAATVSCVRSIAGRIPAGKAPVKCYAVLDSSAAFSAFQFADIGAGIRSSLDFFPLNRHAMWAYKVLVNRALNPSPEGFLPLEGTSGIGPESEDHVHLVIAGMTPAALALAREAAMLAHYPNFVTHPGCRTRISFVDEGARSKMHTLQSSAEALFGLSRRRLVPDGTAPDDTVWTLPSGAGHLGGDFLDAEWEFIEGTPGSPAVRTYLEKLAADPRTRLTVALCSEENALTEALILPGAVLRNAIQVLVYQPYGSSLVEELAAGSTASSAPYGKLRAFGMSSACIDMQLIDELTAAARLLDKDTESGAPASKSDAAKLWSNINNAGHIWTKLRSCAPDGGPIPEDRRDVLARTEHNRWNTEQLLMHFRPLTQAEQALVLEGGTPDPARKAALKREHMAHLDICSWERLKELDPEVLQYDYDMVDSIAKVV